MLHLKPIAPHLTEVDLGDTVLLYFDDKPVAAKVNVSWSSGPEFISLRGQEPIPGATAYKKVNNWVAPHRQVWVEQRLLELLAMGCYGAHNVAASQRLVEIKRTLRLGENTNPETVTAQIVDLFAKVGATVKVTTGESTNGDRWAEVHVEGYGIYLRREAKSGLAALLTVLDDGRRFINDQGWRAK